MPIEHIEKTDTLNEGREKLNNAITAFNETVVEGDSSVEAAQARVDEKGVPHPTLKARIDDGMNSVNQQLAQTEYEIDNIGVEIDEILLQLLKRAVKGEISVYDINKNLGKLDQTYMSDEFLQQIAGNTAINAIPEKNSIVTSQLTKKSVSPYETNFFNVS